VPDAHRVTHDVLSQAEQAARAAVLSRNLHRDLAEMLGPENYAQTWFLAVAQQAEELALLARGPADEADRPPRRLRLVP